MNTKKHPFMFNYAKNTNTTEYLGSDGLPIAETHKLYIKKCEEFKLKARKYAKDNLSTKNSILHLSKYGYSTCKQLEEDILLERMQSMGSFTESFAITHFYEDPNSMYECFSGKSKKIRIIRDLHQEREEDFSNDFDKKKARWFTRYCILSRFIEAARNIILHNRLNRVLAILRTLTPEMIRAIEPESEIEAEEEEEEEGKEDGAGEMDESALNNNVKCCAGLRTL